MLSFFPRGVLDEILNLIESVSEGFPSYSFKIVFVFVPQNLCHKTENWCPRLLMIIRSKNALQAVICYQDLNPTLYETELGVMT